MVAEELTDRQRRFLAQRLDDIDLSVRASNCLKNMEMKYVADLAQYSHADLMHIHNFGRKSLNEIVALFAAEGLPLGITLPEDFSQSRNATPSDDATIEKSESKIELSSDQKAFLASPLSQFFFTARATNFLKRAKLKRVGDLAVLQAAQLRQMQDLGVKSVQELTAFLSKNDIQFGIRIPEWSEELGLAWERQFSSLSDNRRQLDPYLLADPAPKSLDQELYGLTKLVMGAGQERNTRIVCRFFGFDGTGRKTLEEVGAEYNITRERVRQITTRLSRCVRGKRVHVPLVRLARSVIEHELPALERDLIEVLRQESIISGDFDCTGILAAVSLFDEPMPLHVTSIEGLRVVGDVATLDSLKRAPAIARTIVSAFGCGHIEHVMGDIEIADEQGATRRLVLALLESVSGLSWLDPQKEWFTIADTRRNRLSNIVRKMLCVSPDISLSEMRGAIHRVHRLAGFSPPRAILREFCKSLSFCRVTDDRVKAAVDLPLESTLGQIEKCMVEVLRDLGPAMHIAPFRDECLRRGINPNTFYVYLSNSPVLSRLAREMYAVVGAPVSPGEFEESRRRNPGRTAAILDYGWLADGRLWLAYRLNVSNIRGGAFAIPTGTREIVDGQYFIQLADTGSRTPILIEGGRLSGLRRPLSILGAEEADIFRLILDPRSRQAEISFSDEALIKPTATEDTVDRSLKEPTSSGDGVHVESQFEVCDGGQGTLEWQPISTAPALKDLEVRLADSLGRYALLFPCKLLSDGVWMNSWLRTPLLAEPVEWREWTEKPVVF